MNACGRCAMAGCSFPCMQQQRDEAVRRAEAAERKGCDMKGAECSMRCRERTIRARKQATRTRVHVGYRVVRKNPKTGKREWWWAGRWEPVPCGRAMHRAIAKRIVEECAPGGRVVRVIVSYGTKAVNP